MKEEKVFDSRYYVNIWRSYLKCNTRGDREIVNLLDIMNFSDPKAVRAFYRIYEKKGEFKYEPREVKGNHSVYAKIDSIFPKYERYKAYMNAVALNKENKDLEFTEETTVSRASYILGLFMMCQDFLEDTFYDDDDPFKMCLLNDSIEFMTYREERANRIMVQIEIRGELLINYDVILS
jgi:hypothetical protein